MNQIKEAQEFKSGFYFTYPHCNGFADGGKSVVLGRREGNLASLWKCALDSGAETKICELTIPEKDEFWFDIASKANLLVVVANNALWLYDLSAGGGSRAIFQAGENEQMITLPSITADGSHALIGLSRENRYSVLRVDTRSGAKELLFEYPWYANHFHFSPHDEEWIGFCHEGKCELVPDRVWGWHPREAAQGRCIFDQRWDDPARTLFVGHERWAFHAPVVYLVGYGVSPGEPRGIYEAAADGKSSRLISRGDRDLHVNVSRSGRWVVLDTSGPHDAPGRGWENANGISDIFLVDAQTGAREWLARSRIDSHPYHPHPVFSPDERLIFFNEADASRRSGRVMCVENPFY